ncbi:MAG: response regulator [Rhodothermales bacterium]
MRSNLRGCFPAEPSILIVEASEINRHLAHHLLTEKGYSADTVSNGHDAVRAFMKRRYDLIVMDCRLPDFPQFTAVRAIRLHEDKRTPGSRIPIIGLTAYAPPGYRERCLRAGMDACYEKPVRDEIIQQIIRRWLPTSRFGIPRPAASANP